MFDLGRLAEGLGSLLGNGQAQNLAEGGLADLVKAHGIDPQSLAGLDQSAILDLLAEHGIDISQLPLGDVQGLVENLGAGGFDIGELGQRIGFGPFGRDN